MDQDIKQNTFAEIEREEKKYIIKLDDMQEIIDEISKHMKPSYIEKDTDYVLINSLYLDSTDRKSLRLHIGGADHRQKLRLRKYGPNGKWNDEVVFLEIKEKDGEDVHKARIQLDFKNLDTIKSGKAMVLTEALERLNSPLYTYSTLNKFVNKYNKLVNDMGLKPVLSVTYKRLAFGKGSFRITFDTGISSHPVGLLSMSDALKIKNSLDWEKVKEYKKSYDVAENAIMEVKFDTINMPVWTKALLEKYNLEEVKFSKYVYGSYSAIKML